MIGWPKDTTRSFTAGLCGLAGMLTLAALSAPLIVLVRREPLLAARRTGCGRFAPERIEARYRSSPGVRERRFISFRHPLSALGDSLVNANVTVAWRWRCTPRPSPSASWSRAR